MSKRNKLQGFLSQAVKQKKDSEEYIKENITIFPELRDLIEPLTEDEYKQLEENIIEEGCRDPLVLWKYEDQYALIDGHNRYSICSRHDIDFKIAVMDFEDMLGVKNWMINNQLGRRNLTPSQQSFLRGTRYNLEKAQGKRTDLSEEESDSKKSTAQRIAEEHNVDEKTIRRDAKFAEGIDIIKEQNPDLAQNILSGKEKVSKGIVQKLSESLENGSRFDSIMDISRAVKKKQEQKKKKPKQEKIKPEPNPLSERTIEAFRASLHHAIDNCIDNKDKLAFHKLKADLERLEEHLFDT